MGEGADLLHDLVIEEMIGDDERDPEPTTVRCKYCQARNLHWMELDEGWRLVSAKGEIHRCLKAPRRL